jgi:transcriptional regulator of acetoin/glycerol metabolism
MVLEQLTQVGAQFDQKALDPGGARPEIEASWRRCYELGLRPDVLAPPRRDDVALSGLLRATAAYVDSVARDLAETGIAIVVTDDRGCVVARRVSDPLMRELLDGVTLAPGYVWALETAGTSAIGMASAQRAVARVDGPEHFMEPLATLTTAAAPILDPANGALRGVFTLVCTAERSNELLVPVARHCAQTIEGLLADGSTHTDDELTSAFRRARRRARGPFVLVSERVLLMNASAARLVTEADHETLWETARNALTSGVRRSFLCRNASAIECTVEPVFRADQVVAATMRLVPTSARSAPETRPPYGWASLTDTELATAELVAEGLTNREVGQQLFMSRHTVDAHLRHIFRKLHISSRTELTRIVTANMLQGAFKS